jgi:four helix bundle protein
MGDSIKTYRDLIAWQKAYELTKLVYVLAAKLPDFERFSLVASLRRISVSVPSHIAQGYGRGQTNDYLWHLRSARSELYVLDTQLLLCRDFEYVEQTQYETVKTKLDEAERVLAGLIRSLDR